MALIFKLNIFKFYDVDIRVDGLDEVLERQNLLQSVGDGQLVHAAQDAAAPVCVTQVDADADGRQVQE